MRPSEPKCQPSFTSCVITFCSHLAMQGAPMRGVQELVGHQSLAMTQRYSHLSPAALDATIRLLENRATLRAVGDSLETPKG
jgi:site-specific recombinase XerC